MLGQKLRFRRGKSNASANPHEESNYQMPVFGLIVTEAGARNGADNAAQVPPRSVGKLGQ